MYLLGFVFVSVCLCVHGFVCMRVCVNASVCMCVLICICECVGWGGVKRQDRFDGEQDVVCFFCPLPTPQMPGTSPPIMLGGGSDWILVLHSSSAHADSQDQQS